MFSKPNNLVGWRKWESWGGPPSLIAAADFSRVRNADLGRFTVDRLMAIINRLGSRIEVKVRVKRMETADLQAA